MKAVVVCGKGGNFCAGADIKEFNEGNKGRHQHQLSKSDHTLMNMSGGNDEGIICVVVVVDDDYVSGFVCNGLVASFAACLFMIMVVFFLLCLMMVLTMKTISSDNKNL